MTDQRKPVIVCAAIKRDEIVICGARHFDEIMRMHVVTYHQEGLGKRPQWEQGFIDQFGKFYNRQDAMIIVKESGQPLDNERNSGDGKDLYSEGLY